MSDLVKPRRWRLSPHTGQVVPADGGPVGTFTGQEWRAQQWPKCPVCGEQGEPQRVDVREIGERFPRFTIGLWQCPNDCDPRPALQPKLVFVPHLRNPSAPTAEEIASGVDLVDFVDGLPRLL